ncbi:MULTISPECIES: type II toxin-antitoxin system RelE family toxin [Alphaproteobacteria]|nr:MULTISPECIES: hypothetical protein [Alphaproteobacteria]
MQGSRLDQYWRYRLGDNRIICDIHDHKLVVLIIEIDQYSQVYR